MTQHKTLSGPLSLVCVAAQDDMASLSLWETHLLPLQQVGLVTFWSERHLYAGSDRMEQFIAHLDQADCIVFLLSAHFFADDECLTFMQHALLRQQGKVLIPLLLRPVEWQDSALASLPCLPTNRKPITQWPDPDEGFYTCVRGLRSLLNLSADLTTPIHSGARPKTNRERMLRHLQRSYRDLLVQSLQGMVWMELGLTEKPDAVRNVTNLALRIVQHAEEPLPSGTTITQVYEDAEEELLILGEPGSGKSTLLLQLAQHLVVQAEQDEANLLPVILPLSSWAVKRASLEEWMGEQIAVTYDIPRSVSQQWVHDEQILPLLDGLDEMEESARPACIAAINVYHRTHLTPLVVCSRTMEYESAAYKQRLMLQSAVVVQPLTHEQVNAVLDRVGEAVAGLRTAISEQPALQDLATTPLMLLVLMLTYQGKTVHTGDLPETALEQQVWTDYVQHMIDRNKPGNVKRYSFVQTRSWLEWLAREMRWHNQTLFYAERLGADWLTERSKLVYGWLAGLLPAITIGVLTSLFVMIFALLNSDAFLFCQVGLLGGYLGGWLSQPFWTPSDLLSKKKSAHRLQEARLWSSLLLGGLYGASFVLGRSPSLSGLGLVGAGLLSGISVGIMGWLLSGALVRLARSSHSLLTKPTSSLNCSATFLTNVHLRRAAVIALIWGTAVGLSYALRDGPIDGLSYGLNYIPTFGVIGFLLSAIFERGAGVSRFAERLRWNAQRLITPRHLGNTFLLAGFFSLTLIPSYSLRDNLICGLIVGLSRSLSNSLSYWLLFGLFYQGIVAEQVEDQERSRFNQGTLRSLRNGFFISLLSGGMIAGVGILSVVLSEGLSKGLTEGLMEGLSKGLSVGWFLAISSGLLIWVTLGGLTVLRHYIIRFLLARSHTFPWRAQAFLDDATERILMRRVGGGYSFVHRRLLDYFADASSLSAEVDATASFHDPSRESVSESFP